MPAVRAREQDLTNDGTYVLVLRGNVYTSAVRTHQPPRNRSGMQQKRRGAQQGKGIGEGQVAFRGPRTWGAGTPVQTLSVSPSGHLSAGHSPHVLLH
jgi:hypothetical protein